MTPGDFILVHSDHWSARLIQWAQGLHFDHGYAHWNHAAVVVGPNSVIEAKGGRRVRERPLSDYDARDYMIVSPIATADDREQAVKFAQSQIGRKYGYVQIVCLILWTFFGGKLAFGLNGSHICSGLVARAMERTWAIFEKDSENMMPADLAKYYDAKGARLELHLV